MTQSSSERGATLLTLGVNYTPGASALNAAEPDAARFKALLGSDRGPTWSQ